jgi:hypothetical protein
MAQIKCPKCEKLFDYESEELSELRKDVAKLTADSVLQAKRLAGSEAVVLAADKVLKVGFSNLGELQRAVAAYKKLVGA